MEKSLTLDRLGSPIQGEMIDIMSVGGSDSSHAAEAYLTIAIAAALEDTGVMFGAVVAFCCVDGDFGPLVGVLFDDTGCYEEESSPDAALVVRFSIDLEVKTIAAAGRRRD
jgi:hypothetical protein